VSKEIYLNAFYTCAERSRSAISEKVKNLTEPNEPAVSLTTKKIDDKVQLTVRDNCNCIPQKVADKIFQQFFSTKLTEEGTGLGFKLRYH
jgi:C4-dicarboxylate-specific signal transduction histidine kinase